MIPLHFRPAPTYVIEWDAPCPGCDTVARWCQNPSGTGVAPPVIYCPSCNPRPAVSFA